MSQNLHKHNFRQKTSPQRMCETTHKHTHIEQFSKAKVAWLPSAPIYYSIILTFPKIHPNLLQFTYKVDLNANTKKNYPKNYMSADCNACDIYNVRHGASLSSTNVFILLGRQHLMSSFSEGRNPLMSSS